MPPSVGVAVNVTFVPAQIGLAEATMPTVGVTGVFTVIVISLLVAVGDVTHVILLVITTVILSPFTNVLSE